jgi:hypothetical protein
LTFALTTIENKEKILFTEEELEFINHLVKLRKTIISVCIPQLEEAVKTSKKERKEKYKEELENEKHRLTLAESILSKLND